MAGISSAETPRGVNVPRDPEQRAAEAGRVTPAQFAANDAMRIEIEARRDAIEVIRDAEDAQDIADRLADVAQPRGGR